MDGMQHVVSAEEHDRCRMLEHIVCAQMDDLRDASKLADYAEDAKAADNASLASYFAQRAKSRLSAAAEAERYIDDLAPSGADGGERTMYRHALRRYVDEQSAAVKRRLEKLM